MCFAYRNVKMKQNFDLGLRDVQWLLFDVLFLFNGITNTNIGMVNFSRESLILDNQQNLTSL